MVLNYFGTDLNSAGHYFFQVYIEAIGRSNVRFEKLPFNPESLPYNVTSVGEVRNYHAFGFTILAICGSVADKRPGCKSIFFVEKALTFEEMEYLVRSTQFGATVLDTLIPKPPQQ